MPRCETIVRTDRPSYERRLAFTQDVCCDAPIGAARNPPPSARAPGAPPRAPQRVVVSACGCHEAARSPASRSSAASHTLQQPPARGPSRAFYAPHRGATLNPADRRFRRVSDDVHPADPRSRIPRCRRRHGRPLQGTRSRTSELRMRGRCGMTLIKKILFCVMVLVLMGRSGSGEG